MYKLGRKTTKNLESILRSGKEESAILVKAVRGFIRYTPIDFCIIESGGYRTKEMQFQLFRDERSKCDGYNKLSEHQKGLAVDLVPWVNGGPTWDLKSTYYLSGAFMLYCRENGLHITSGADWNGDGNLIQSFNDPCHMQIKEF